MLEKASYDSINITDASLMFYLNIYFKQIGLKPKMTKLKRIVSESPSHNIFTITYSIREGNSEYIKPMIKEGVELKNDINIISRF